MREEDKTLRPSEVIDNFLDWLNWCKTEQDAAWGTVTLEDEKVQDYLHKLEFCNDCGERSRIATEWHKSRVKRRAAKDRSKEYSEVAKYVSDPRNKLALNNLRKLAGEQRKTEDFLRSDRKYVPRALKEGDPDPDNT